MINAFALDRLDPLYRADFNDQPIRTWRVVWPSGHVEEVQAHTAMQYGGREHEVLGFAYRYLGPHRWINLAHVVEVVEIIDPAA